MQKKKKKNCFTKSMIDNRYVGYAPKFYEFNAFVQITNTKSPYLYFNKCEGFKYLISMLKILGFKLFV